MAVLVAVAVSAGYAWHVNDQQRLSWQGDPTRAYMEIIGRPLPPGLHAVAYRQEITDTFLHVSHYWLLRGSSSSLRQVLAGTSLGESTEDAQWALPDTDRLFGRPRIRTDVVVGYEDESPRNNWYWIFTGEQEAVLEYNGGIASEANNSFKPKPLRGTG